MKKALNTARLQIGETYTETEETKPIDGTSNSQMKMTLRRNSVKILCDIAPILQIHTTITQNVGTHQRF